MNENEAHPRAAALLADAGWTPHPGWGVYTRGTLVMGGDHLGGFHVKDWGLDIHGPDTPDTAEEAAAWLVQRFAIPADVVTLDYAPEPEQTPVHDDISASDSGAPDGAGGDGEAGRVSDPGEPLGGAGSSGASADGGGDDGRGDERSDEPLYGDSEGAGSAEPIDADFEPIPDLPEIELIPPEADPDFGAELLEFEGELSEPKEEAPSGAFIFGDNIDQKRTAAIGLVVQIALQKMPQITPADDARLAELRNFTLGVSEGRWANDPNKQAELEALELIASLAREVEAARDAKVGFLVAATREEIEAFDPEADWP